MKQNEIVKKEVNNKENKERWCIVIACDVGDGFRRNQKKKLEPSNAFFLFRFKVLRFESKDCELGCSNTNQDQPCFHRCTMLLLRNLLFLTMA